MPRATETPAVPAGFPYEAVVWDWNGTLLDDVETCVRVMNGLLRPRGLPELTTDRYQRIFQFPVVRYYAALGFDFEREPFENVGREFIAAYEKVCGSCSLRAGAREALRRIHQAGVPQYVLSAYRQDRLHVLLRRMDVAQWFEGLCGGSDDFAHGKAERGRQWRDSWRGGRSAKMLLIGDTDHDVEVARVIGADCWLVSGGHQGNPRLRACGVPLFEDLVSLPLPGTAG